MFICGSNLLPALSIFDNDYSDYVEHPRFGRGPRLRPDVATCRATAVTTWESIEIQPAGFRPLPGQSCHIAGTEVPADLQAIRPMPCPPRFTHYLDLDQCCWGCARRFIFFAEEQKYWYESLRFYLSSPCINCVECRKTRQRKTRPFVRAARRYQDLLGIKNRTVEQTLEMVSAGLDMAEKGQGGRLLMERLRHLARSIPREILEAPASEDVVTRLWKGKT